jgi:lipoprotein-anchoring transpeptidase ErfK/SrfK
VRILEISFALLFGAFAFNQAEAATFKIFGGMGNGEPRQQGVSPRIVLEKQLVDFDRPLVPGSLLVRTSERALYYVLPDGKAWKYPVGVGREGFAWSGANTISRMAEWPEWRPPKIMIDREAKRGNYLPAMMKGGTGNPLGARALYIGDTEFRIHGTTQPNSIGRAVSSGCIRMLNAHVIDLYNHVTIGASVIVER